MTGFSIRATCLKRLGIIDASSPVVNKYGVPWYSSRPATGKTISPCRFVSRIAPSMFASQSIMASAALTLAIGPTTAAPASIKYLSKFVGKQVFVLDYEDTAVT